MKRNPTIINMKDLTIYKKFKFESAHFLPNVPDSHQCKRMHGHSYEVIVSVRGELDRKKGWVMDYRDVGIPVKKIVSKLDHQVLNEIKGLENPTAENLCWYFWQKLEKHLPTLYRIEVKETEKTGSVIEK
jgi:6-pyruvoyltetrahydropterin/6-carboxytetrahydropterin synthase|tara:strand:+ start:314 stop:703 length:390 start_codon:yes stop_codon:yes gene_type:complete